MIEFIVPPEELNRFLAGVMEDMAGGSSDSAVNEMKFKELFRQLDLKMLATLSEMLTVSQITDLEGLVKSGESASVGDIQRFLISAIPNIAEETGKVLSEFRSFYVAS